MQKKVTQKQLKKLEKRARNKADKDWQLAVKERDGNACVICGETKYIQSHHIIPREIKTLRHDVDNGITLCANHHKWSLECSPHRNPLIFFKLMERRNPEQIKRLVDKYYNGR